MEETTLLHLKPSSKWDVLEETGPHRTRSPPSDHHIAQGQRVRAYAIHGQAAAGGAWEVLATGASVGNKAIVLLPGGVGKSPAQEIP
eukprot:gene14095-biopygen5316